MVLKLYGEFTSQPCRAVAVFLKVNNIEYDFNIVHLGKLEHRSPAFLAVNPMGQIPAIDDDGFCLAEGVTILKYLCATRSVPAHWYPADVKQRAKLDWILDWYHSNLRKTAFYVFHTVLAPMYGLRSVGEKAIRDFETAMTFSLEFIEANWLTADGPFLLGATEPSLADLVLVCEVEQLVLLNKEGQEAALGKREKIKQWAIAVKEKLNPHYAEVCATIFETAKVLEEKRNTHAKQAAL